MRVDGFEVFELQFGINDFLIGHRIYGHAALAHDIIIVEAADDMDDGVALTDVSKEFIAQTFALARTFHEAGDVDNLAGGRHDATRMHDFG